MRLTDLLALSHVPRWSVVRHTQPQSVADHSFRVAVIYLELCERLDRHPTLSGLTWALYHDGPEARSGDIPGNFKTMITEEVQEAEEIVARWCTPAIAGGEAWHLVHLADQIEAYCFIFMNGVGMHAGGVAARCLDKVVEATTGKGTFEYDVVCGPNGILHDITNEMGRL